MESEEEEEEEVRADRLVGSQGDIAGLEGLKSSRPTLQIPHV